MPKARRRPIQPADFYLLKNVADVQVSPDGKQVAYTAVWPDKEANETRSSVYLAPMDGLSPARRFTHGDKDHSPRWSPDGRRLAFVSERGEKNQLFVAPMEGGEARQVTHAEHGISQPAWSPDGKKVAYVTRVGHWTDPKERNALEKAEPRVIVDLRYKLDGVGFFDNRRVHIFTVDTESGETNQVTSGDYNDDQPAWSPDGKTIVFASDRERQRHQRHWRVDVWAVPSSGGRARKLTRSRGSASHPTFSPDGRWIAFVGHEHGDAGVAKNVHLMVVPAKGGVAPVSLSASTDRPVAGWPAFVSGRTFSWTPDGGSLLFVAGDRGTQALYRAGLKGGTVEKVLDGERQIEGFSLSPAGDRIAFTAVWMTEPPEVYATALSGRAKEANLSHINDELKAVVEIAPMERLSYRAPDGWEIEAFVMYPPDYRKGRRYPLAVSVHGGPHSFHPGARSWTQFHALAGSGYVVLLPNPRGSTTYGEAFAEACVRDWGGKDYEDIIAGVDVLLEEGVADPERLYIGGYSYGGFMASWAVGHTDRFRAAVVGAPVSNEASMFGTGDIPLFDMHEIGGTPQDNPDEYWFRSPVAYLANVKTPVLLIHHEGDLRCPISQSEEIFHALKMMGKEVEFVRYPGGFHTYNTHAPSQVVDHARRIIDWYESHAPAKAKYAVARRAPAKRKAVARRR
jgi:dipeptidyl aminopeptidase/acylaminoacyl peptidase